jgi:tetratricopeptide (TPR) repeat protein
MDRPHPYLLTAAVAAIALGLAICATAAERDEHAQTQTELSPLLDQANALARSGHHEEAIPLLQRAVAIMRSQYGVFDLRQQDTLKALASSLTAAGRVPEAQDAMIYRAHVAEKTYGEGSPKIIPALCDLGDFFSETGKAPEAHLTFSVALNIVGASPPGEHNVNARRFDPATRSYYVGAADSLTDPIVVEPLRGIARTYMRTMSYPDAWTIRGLSFLTRGLKREGEDALKRALRILDADPSATTPETRIETLIQMGDWQQIKKAPREALPYYQRAWKLIHEAASLSSSAATALNVPVRVYYPTPSIVAQVPTQEETRSHYVQTEFTVAADGSVSGASIVDHDTRDRYADDVLDAVRAARFRPKFVDGQAVATPGITYREVFWTAKPRE